MSHGLGTILFAAKFDDANSLANAVAATSFSDSPFAAVEHGWMFVGSVKTVGIIAVSV